MKNSNTGRKAHGALSSDYQITKRITIDCETERIMRSIGKGNLSAGIRIAAGLLQKLIN